MINLLVKSFGGTIFVLLAGLPIVMLTIATAVVLKSFLLLLLGTQSISDFWASSPSWIIILVLSLFAIVIIHTIWKIISYISFQVRIKKFENKIRNAVGKVSESKILTPIYFDQKTTKAFCVAKYQLDVYRPVFEEKNIEGKMHPIVIFDNDVIVHHFIEIKGGVFSSRLFEKFQFKSSVIVATHSTVFSAIYNVIYIGGHAIKLISIPILTPSILLFCRTSCIFFDQIAKNRIESWRISTFKKIFLDKVPGKTTDLPKGTNAKFISLVLGPDNSPEEYFFYPKKKDGIDGFVGSQVITNIMLNDKSKESTLKFELRPSVIGFVRIFIGNKLL